MVKLDLNTITGLSERRTGQPILCVHTPTIESKGPTVCNRTSPKNNCNTYNYELSHQSLVDETRSVTHSFTHYLSCSQSGNTDRV